MRDKSRRASHLRLVPDLPPEPMQEKKEIEIDSKGQLSLFSDTEPVTICIVNLARVSSSEFVELVRDFRPKWVMDLRPLPYFNIDRLSRRVVFRLFEECNASYRDIASTLGAFSRKDALLNAGVVVHELTRVLSEAGGNRAIGPILVLLDDEDSARLSADVFPKLLQPKPRGGWRAQLLVPTQKYAR